MGYRLPTPVFSCFNKCNARYALAVLTLLVVTMACGGCYLLSLACCRMQRPAVYTLKSSGANPHLVANIQKCEINLQFNGIKQKGSKLI